MITDTEHVLNYFHKNISAVEKLDKKVHARPGKKKVHDLRVAIRRLLSLRDAFGLPDTPNLKKLAKVAGKVRDLDVGIEFAANFSLDTDHMKKARRDRKKKLIQKSKKKIRKKIQSELSYIESELHSKIQQDMPHLEQYLRTLNELLNQNLTEQNAHQVRISFKRARYLLEAFHLPSDWAARLQDVLGELHDLQVLSEEFEPTEDMLKLKKELLIQGEEIKARALDQVNSGLSSMIQH